MFYNENYLNNINSASRAGASSQARANDDQVPTINSNVARSQGTLSSGSRGSSTSESPEQMSPATAMAALNLNQFATTLPSPDLVVSPAARIQMLTHRVAELEGQLEVAQQQLLLLSPAGTVNPAHLTMVTPAMPMAAPTTLRRPGDHKQRTERRSTLRKLLNRNGNRCCAWCEPRRERRRYGPRQAPDDQMTCGCTVEDALFEESLARNGIGSMDTSRQRLDPELRRDLLALLKNRYKYQDGDLDFNHDTLEWESGGNAESWMSRDKFE